MSTNGITEIELAMFEKGYASARLICNKTQMHRSTVCRLIRHKKLTGTKVGKVSFVTIKSVALYMGAEGSAALNLDDWTDVLV